MSTLQEIYETKDSDYYQGARPEMVDLVPKTAETILDIGCGEGHFAAGLKKELGAEVSGIELDEKSAALAVEKLDKVYSGDVNEIIKGLPESYYDCITCNDVLEHLVDPYSILKQLKSKLAPEGLIVSSIPNVLYFRVLANLLFKGDWKYENEGVLDRTHLRFFTRKSIIRMFEEAGYEIVSIKPIAKTKSLRPYFYRVFTLGLFPKDTYYVQYATVVKIK